MFRRTGTWWFLQPRFTKDIANRPLLQLVPNTLVFPTLRLLRSTRIGTLHSMKNHTYIEKSSCPPCFPSFSFLSHAPALINYCISLGRRFPRWTPRTRYRRQNPQSQLHEATHSNNITRVPSLSLFSRAKTHPHLHRLPKLP